MNNNNYASSDKILKLRELTGGASMRLCIDALKACEGDVSKAFKRISINMSTQKLNVPSDDNGAYFSSVGCRVYENGRAISVELASNTDFVLSNSSFISTLENIMDIMSQSDDEIGSKEALLKIVDKSSGRSIDEIITYLSNIVKENIRIITFKDIKYDRNSLTAGYYVHQKVGNGYVGKYAALIFLKCPESEESKEIANECATHAGVMEPKFLNKESAPEDIIDIYLMPHKKKIDQSDKPENIKAKMLEGAEKKFLSQFSLVDQEYFRDTTVTVGEMVRNSLKHISNNVLIDSFYLFSAKR